MTDDVVALPHTAPLARFHIVVAPRRHVAGFYDLDVLEQRMVWNMVGEVKRRIALSIPVKGFDIGFEDRPSDHDAAHVLVHVVPRSVEVRPHLPAGIEWVDGSE